MQINTKFELGQQVFILYDNILCSGFIHGIKVVAIEQPMYNLHDLWFHEELLFESKELLIEALEQKDAKLINDQIEPF